VNTAYREESARPRCARCGWPIDEARVLSTHHTSEGWVRYRRCPCGSVAIELVHLDSREPLHAEALA
jgi:hypothetical protein